MNVISVKKLRAYADRHPASRAVLETWARTALGATWANPVDVKATFPTADAIGEGRYVFDIGGNRWRLVAFVSFERGTVLLKWIGSHAEYDKIDVRSVAHE